MQYSVFECLIDREHLDKMLLRLKKVVNDAEDSIRIYALCRDCEKVIKIIGQGKVTKEEKYYIL